MTNDGRRNLMDGWCPEGERLTEATQRVNREEWERITQEFPLTKLAEQTAPLLLYAFTGLNLARPLR